MEATVRLVTEKLVHGMLDTVAVVIIGFASCGLVLFLLWMAELVLG